MMARVRVDGKMLDEIEVKNESRQSRTMVPTVFNLYSCMVEVTEEDSWCGWHEDSDAVQV